MSVQEFGGEPRALGIDGAKPVFHRLKAADDFAGAILDRLEELLDEGVIPGQIQVLSSKTYLRDELRGIELGEVPLVELGGEGIAVETIHRFKGLEAPIVLVAFPEGLDEDDLTLAYTGFSRAQSVLEVFGTKTTRQTVHWGGDG